jgi:crotonobetainyl-CoA:carnitine CoA-transferase CaiB-like acyl-CoA transferase
VSRNVTGRGQLVDTSLMEAAVQQTYWQSALYFATGVNPQPSDQLTVRRAVPAHSRRKTAGSTRRR